MFTQLVKREIGNEEHGDSDKGYRGENGWPEINRRFGVQVDLQSTCIEHKQ